MALEAGTRLGPYEILELRGKGGMGEVYRARDSRLEREVAVKVLPAELSGDAAFRSRLEREAKTVSRLQHPNVCVLYDASFDGGRDYLVMELLAGETLADRIGRGALPLADVVRVGIEIAEGVAAAHRLGIVHRDLKPGNVMLTATGAKVLDFGLAKGFEAELAGVDSLSPTLAQPLTTRGAIAGTLQYMSPEQLEGGDADARSDLWALGCVLYEMASGECAFTGRSAASAIAAVMTSRPQPLQERREGSPPRLDWLIERCLERDPERRWQSAKDLALELEALAREHRHPESRTRGAGAAAPPRLLRATLELPPRSRLVRPGVSMGNPLALSPDGRVLVVAAVCDGESRLYRRSLDSLELEPIAETEGATSPFFSSDGAWLGFHAGGWVQKMPSGGGHAVPLVKLPAFYGVGAYWSENDRIALSPSNLGSGLLLLSTDGRDAREVTQVDVERSEWHHAWPQLLPGGSHVLFTVWGWKTGGATVASIETGETRQVRRGALGARLIAPDLMVYRNVVSSELEAVRWDPERLEAIGDARALAERVYLPIRSGGIGNLAVSGDGTLVYEPAGSDQRSLVWMDLEGRELGRLDERGPYDGLALSPDGRRVAFSWNERRSLPGRIASGSGGDLWVHDFERGTRERLTSRGDNISPVWSPDGAELAFSSNRAGAWNLFRKAVDGGGEATHWHESPTSGFPASITQDGTVLMSERGRDGDTVRRVTRAGALLEAAGSTLSGWMPRISPDGRFLAWVGYDSGRAEVYVEPYPATGRRIRVSAAGGSDPRWAPSGREIFYLRGDELWTVPVETDSSFRPGRPRFLFAAPFAPDFVGCYDIAPDGERLLMVEREPDRPLHIVTGWAEEVRRLLGSAR